LQEEKLMSKKPRIAASGILPVLFSGLLLVFLASCGEGPTKLNVKESNQPPETVITAKTLSKTALETDTTGAFTNLTDFAFTVEYTGSDQDGTVDSFSVRVDGGAWTAFSEKRTFSGTIQLTSQTDVRKVEVRAKDNEGGIDPTPAEASLSLQEITANKAPTTAFVSGPANGATTGRGVKFGISATDEDGTVAKFFYSLDGGAEVEMAADSEGKGTIEFSTALGNLLEKGTHSVSVYSQDNLGANDPTPATVSFFVTTGFKPILTQTGGPPPGGGWFTGANIPFAWNVSTDHYSGVIDHFEFSIDDPANFSSTTDQGVSLDPQTAGAHIFRLKAIDTEGNESEVLEVDFDVAAFEPTEGILLLDNVSFTPGGGPYNSEPEMDQMILDGFFKNFTKVSVWDVDRLSGSRRFPGAINDKARPGPADLAKYSSIVIMTDGGASAAIDPRQDAALYAAYFQAGGNLMVTGYNAVGFGQVLKDVLGTPTVFNGFGSNLMSLEGFQEASSRNSDAYAFLTGNDVVPVIPGITNRSWEITTSVSGKSFRVLFGNVFEGGSFGGFRIATETQGEKGNWGLWLGVSLFYLDQTSTGIVKFGDFVLGTRFGEM
jgi:hypothetical protein